ncbi:5-(carboxyamino)imidazole ribonucleotide synthase [Candidatus Izimaplasma bacterium ZiA1]|uniref:5-(carboxyamino)imidazole ribonucleotide synthase n=1 Tax=Candidatus Izimoplasma sp. ZiA1 TaxID=2024899 RepID=UPI000BAA7DB0|nr:5-(carboxyamino)imidazole ribonucleotide synthase [Candidatus Izimaplasma bacterium ZiA1]
MKIGIIGGGQLGMMMAHEAKKLNHQVYSLDPSKDAPIIAYSDLHIVSDFTDYEKVQHLIDITDCVTYEFENIYEDFIKKNVNKIPQKHIALEISKYRLNEKAFASSLDILTPRYKKVTSLKDLENAFYPSILKTNSLGYDGKGQYLLSSYKDALNITFDKDYILEEKINFDYEISTVLTRDNHGNIVLYPIPVNKHVNGILFTSTVLSSFDKTITKKAFEHSKRIIEELDYVGTLAVEYFIKGDEIIFNEIAPRPHNSGHYTIEGTNNSQFKNHILAITNETIKNSVLLSNTLMINVLGQNTSYYDKAKSLKNAFIHHYNKDENKFNRKIGHITITDLEVNEINSLTDKITKE